MPTSQFVGKQAFIRLIAQMSNEEIIALAVLSQLEDSIPPYTGEMPPPKASVSKKFSGFRVDELAKELGWNEMDTKAAYEGLLQLGLVLDSMAGTMGHFGNQHQYWQSTVLGQRVQQFSLDYASIVIN